MLEEPVPKGTEALIVLLPMDEVATVPTAVEDDSSEDDELSGELVGRLA